MKPVELPKTVELPVNDADELFKFAQDFLVNSLGFTKSQAQAVVGEPQKS